MKNLILAILALFLLAGCSNGKLDYRKGCPDFPSDYWIENEGAKAVYLVNTSKTKKITFTVKITRSESSEFGNDVDTNTDTYTLNPGAEIYLSCSNTIHKDYKNTFVKYRYEIVGELVEK